VDLILVQLFKVS